MSLESKLKGWVGEQKTRLVQKLLLDNNVYHQINNVIIHTQRGTTTQIDQIIVSKYGIFVIETKDKKGWIYGDKNSKQWTQVIKTHHHINKYQFQNPLNQNYAHTRSVAEFLNIPHKKIHSVVVFWGGCEFKTKPPDNVIAGSHTGYIKSKKEVLLSNEEGTTAWNKLLTLKSNTPLLAGFSHVKSLKQRYTSDTVCPKCGSALVKRKAHEGTFAGREFLGCKAYPRCSYTKKL
jgi:restriction system protein